MSDEKIQPIEIKLADLGEAKVTNGEIAFAISFKPEHQHPDDLKRLLGLLADGHVYDLTILEPEV